MYNPLTSPPIDNSHQAYVQVRHTPASPSWCVLRSTRVNAVISRHEKDLSIDRINEKLPDYSSSRRSHWVW